ncbi:MAG TPA: hypothetical protein VFS74_09005, partial [Gemmatimonadales bacterium]|nr:hypothetical protein [Gemmatimonadales bacterium]
GAAAKRVAMATRVKGFIGASPEGVDGHKAPRYASPSPSEPERRMLLYYFGMIFAIIGAGAILFALPFVSTVIGGLINAMITLMAGPIVDKVLARRKS